MNLRAPFAATVVAVPMGTDDAVRAGTPVIVLEAMKMEHELLAETDATVERLEVKVGDNVEEGQLLAVLATNGGLPSAGPVAAAAADHGPLETVRERHALGLDEARPDAVQKRRELGRRTARENLADLLDPDSFVEYGPLMHAAQEQRREKQELIERTPADGLVGGIGSVDGRAVRGHVL